MAGFRFSVSAAEWDDVGRFVYPSLALDEHEVIGHFLVELRGDRRTWVATDGPQLAALEVEGHAAEGPQGPLTSADVLVNPRLLRGQPPTDCTIEVDGDADDGGRLITVEADGVRSTLPEHPGAYPDRREVLAEVEARRGADVHIGRVELLRALAPAMVRPTGSDEDDDPPVMMGVADGHLWLEVAWEGLPATRVRAPVVRHAGESFVWVNPQRLWSLVSEVDDEEIQLVLPDDQAGPILLRASGYTAILMPLNRLGPARRRLEQLLCAYLGLDEVVRDDDGDYPVRTEDDVVYFVRLDHPELPTVRVFAVMASGVEPSFELLSELNDINASSPQLKAILVEGAVMAEIEIVATSLDRAELEVALERVTTAVRRYRPLLEGFFSTPS